MIAIIILGVFCALLVISMLIAQLTGHEEIAFYIGISSPFAASILIGIITVMRSMGYLA